MSGGTTQTNTNSISPWMEEAAKAQLGKATALTDINQNPYKQYEGQRIAEFNPMQQQFFQGIGNLQGSGAINQGIGAAGDVTQRALNTQYNPYQTGQFGAQAGQYMDPYMQNVVDIQQREAQRQADIARTQSNANAVKSGAFGGGRQAIVDAEAARNLATQKGDIQARGLQDAYSRAQQMFNTEQALGESSRQYGAGLGMRGLETALSGASQLGGLGSTQFGQQKDILGLQSVAGAQQQAQEQAKLSQGYEDFLAKEKYPYQQLEFMSNIMRGTPYGTTTSMYSPGPSTASTLLGAGTSLAGAALMGGKWTPWMSKEGGLATAYAAGGSVDSSENIQSIADKLLDAQLPQSAAMAQARGDKEQADIIQQEMASRAALRSVAQAMPEDQGIGQLPAGNMNYANGGIIAFADGGDVERYQVGGSTQVEQILKKPPFQRTPEENALLATAGYKLQRAVIPQGSAVDAANTALKGVGPSLRNTFTAGTNQLTDEQLAQMPAAGGALNEKILRGLGSTPAPALTATPTAVAQAAPTNSTAAMAAKASASPYGTSVLPAADPAASPRAMLNQADQTARKDFDVYGGKAAPKVDTTRKVPAAGLAAANAANQSSGPTTIEDLQTKYYGPLDKDFQAQDKALNELVKAVADAPKKDLEEIKAEQAARGDVFKAREERLGKREQEAALMGSKYAGLALLQAGAAMMSTPGGLGMAIGRGVQVGSDRYLSGIEKINQAKEKFDEARDRMEDLRINRDDMNAREIRQAKSAITAAEVKGKELLNIGARDKLNMKSKQIDAVFGAAANALNTDKTIAAERENTLIRERGANARASMLPADARTTILLGTGNTDRERYESGLKRLQEITADKSGMAAVKLLAETNAKLAPGEPKVTMSDLLASAREYSALMYPKVGAVAPTRARP